MADFEKVVTPKGELRYVNVTGEGKLDFDGKFREYTATLVLGKKDAKKFEKELLAIFEENKPSKWTKPPVNKFMRKTEDGDYTFSFKTRVVKADGNQQKITIKNPKNVETPLPDGVGIGNGSIGRISGNVSVYKNGKGSSLKAGISLWLSGIQLLKFVKYVPNDGFDEEDGDFESFDNSEFAEVADEKPKKKKKKSKK